MKCTHKGQLLASLLSVPDAGASIYSLYSECSRRGRVSLVGLFLGVPFILSLGVFCFFCYVNVLFLNACAMDNPPLDIVYSHMKDFNSFENDNGVSSRHAFYQLAYYFIKRQAQVTELGGQLRRIFDALTKAAEIKHRVEGYVDQQLESEAAHVQSVLHNLKDFKADSLQNAIDTVQAKQVWLQ